MSVKRMKTWSVETLPSDGLVYWVGEDSEGERWVDALLIGAGPEDGLAFAKEMPGSVLPYPHRGTFLVKVKAILARCPTPEAVRDISRVIGDFFEASRPSVPFSN